MPAFAVAAPVIVPSMATRVVDWAIQAYGGAGVCQDSELAHLWAGQRTLRLADGPDEVHRNAIAKLELSPHRGRPADSVQMPITRGA